MKFNIFKKGTLTIMTAFCLFLFVFIGACAIYTFLTSEPIYISIIIVLIALGPLGLFLHLLKWDYYNAYAEIDEIGISFVSRKRNFDVAWENIYDIGLTEYTHGTKGICIRQSESKEISASNLAIKKTTEDFIFLEFRKRAYKEIKKHWGGKILGENIYRRHKKI